MAGFSTHIRFVVTGWHNLKNAKQASLVTLKGCKCQNQVEICRSYSIVQNDLEEKKRRFRELEDEYRKFLRIDQLTVEERRIHFLHAEAVARGHFTYDDPCLEEKVLTRLRHFLKGKCCGKSCRHCIYDHTAVADEKKKSLARFNSSFWVYDGGVEEDPSDFDQQYVVTYGRGPYPRKYAENAPQNMIKIPSKPRPVSQ